MYKCSKCLFGKTEGKTSVGEFDHLRSTELMHIKRLLYVKYLNTVLG